MATAFTTWRNLHSQLLDNLAGGAWGTMQSYTVSGTAITYRSLEELKKCIEWAAAEANKEEGTSAYIGRTSARSRSRWS